MKKHSSVKVTALGDQHRSTAPEAGEKIVVPVLQETVKVGRKRVETGRVKVRKVMREHDR
jgi:hypothetical protein